MENNELYKSICKQVGIIRFGKNKGQLNSKKVCKKKVLAFRECNIENLDFLKSFKSLESLMIADNSMMLKDISGLKYTMHLKNLVICDNPINDITPLKNCREINTLNISNCNIKKTNNVTITDFSIISKLVNLRHLYLMKNGITDIDFVKNLRSLVDLDLENNAITDIKVLKNLEKLEMLNISNNQIEDSSIVKTLKNIKTAYLYTDN